MNKKYIDFVPVKGSGVANGHTARPNSKREEIVYREPATRERKRVNEASSSADGKLGVIEELSSRFIETEVPKRPLSAERSRVGTKRDALSAAKSKKVRASRLLSADDGNKSARAADEHAGAAAKTALKKTTYNVPKNPFINQNKVPKRPLSKNVYQKKIEPIEEKATPVAIIDKPKKESRGGLLIVIVITILIGAAAGTVAFLFLPK